VANNFENVLLNIVIENKLENCHNKRGVIKSITIMTVSTDVLLFSLYRLDCSNFIIQYNTYFTNK